MARVAPTVAAVPAPTRGPTCFQELPGHMSTLAASAAAYRARGARPNACGHDLAEHSRRSQQAPARGVVLEYSACLATK